MAAGVFSDVTLHRFLLLETGLEDAKRRIEPLEARNAKCRCQPLTTRDAAVQSDFYPDPILLSGTAYFGYGRDSPISNSPHNCQPSSEGYSAAVMPFKEEPKEPPIEFIESEVKELNSDKRLGEKSTAAVPCPISTETRTVTDNVQKRKLRRNNTRRKPKGKGQAKPCVSELVSCGVCSLHFSSSALLMSHQKQDHPATNRRHKCPHCEYSARKRCNFKRHFLRKHTAEKPFSCSQCDKKFKSKKGLALHLKTHKPQDEYEYQCHVCQMRFRYSKSLTVHLKSHTGKAPIILKSAFARHYKRQHNGEKPFACVHCKMAFNSRSTARRHVIRVHTKDYPFKCDKCPKGFFAKAMHNKHRCSKEFKTALAV